MDEYFLAAASSYLLFNDLPARAAAVRAAATGALRDKMVAIALTLTQAPDTVMILLIMADRTRSLHKIPLPVAAEIIRDRAGDLMEQIENFKGGLVILRQQLHLEAPTYAIALGGFCRPNAAVFNGLDPNAMERLAKLFS